MRVLLGLALALALSAAAAYLLWPRSEETPEGMRAASIGAETFVYPTAYARDEATALGGVAARLAFAARFPDFDPPVTERSKHGQEPPSRQDLVLVTISVKDDGLDPSERPTRLYARFLEGAAAVGPEGLVMRRFEPGSPYDLEQLYLAPPDGRAFFARCPNQANAEAAAAGDFCLFLFRDGGLDVELRFPPALLEHWEALAAGGRAFLARIRIADRRTTAAGAGGR
ncbi:MAG TPA: hypothetical protein VK446_13270 [Methylocystis sp.]|nr:hypothetical protein [Methylocystis sp.]